MRRYLLLLFFVLSFCFTSSAEASKLALLVGVDEYVNVQSLHCCVNDINTLKEALMKIEFDEDDIQILVTGASDFKALPTKRNIEKKISELLSKAKPDDIVFIALSGHGAQDVKNVYFCPPDVEVEDLEGTCVSINKIMDDLAKCNAKFKWMVVDACRNDPTQGPKGIGGKGMQVIPTPPAGIALFQSCAEGEQSWEDLENGNGFFTKNFAAALSGKADSDNDGKLTLMEVCKWTTAQTKEQVKNSKNKTQRPYFSGSITDFTLIENQDILIATNYANEARAATKAGNYFLAKEKYNKALEICPNNAQWKHELELVEQLIKNTSPQNPTSPDPMKIEVPKDFTTIEEAYKNVLDGGMITIQPGIYELSATLVVNRPVTFRGSTGRPEDVVINYQSSHTIKITGGSPSFQNLTATCGGEECGAFYITGGNPNLFHCIITSRKDSGIIVEGEKADPQVNSCICKNCEGNGILVWKNGHGKFNDCEISDNVLPGIGVASSGNPTFTGCKIHDNKQTGVIVRDKAFGSFNNCEFYKNEISGIQVSEASNPTFTRCKIHDEKENGVIVVEKTHGKFINCEIYGNAGAGIVVQKSANPTFTECKIHDMKIYGVVVFDKGLGKFNDCEIYGNKNAGIFVQNVSNPIFTGCIVHDGKDAGVAVVDNAFGKFIKCDIFRNSAAGFIVQTSSNPTITECKIHDGKSNGVFVSDKGFGQFSGCEVYGNVGAGIAVKTSGNPTFTECKIYYGKDAGAFIYQTGFGQFNDCDIYGNVGSGVVVKMSGNPTFTGCKIHDGKDSGILVMDAGFGKFINCDIYKNASSGIELYTSGKPTVTGCKIHDGKHSGVRASNKGMGTFNNNKLDRNYRDGNLDNWHINLDAGDITGSGNTPPIPPPWERILNIF